MKRSEYFEILEIFDHLILDRTKKTDEYCRRNGYDPEICRKMNIKNSCYVTALKEARIEFCAKYQSKIPDKDE